MKLLPAAAASLVLRIVVLCRYATVSAIVLTPTRLCVCVCVCVSVSVCVSVCLCGQRGGAWTGEVDDSKRKKDDLKAMAKIAKAAVVRYVFNYNFLESVSIITSTAVLLAGMVRACVAVVQRIL